MSDPTLILEYLRVPLETIGLLLLIDIRHSVRVLKARIEVVEDNMDIHYPKEMVK